MKIDVKKTFHTLDWCFLLKVLQSFGFNIQFCKWIEIILLSAKLSLSVNGNAIGFFNCKRGLRQGDPLSPFLFCLTEEVLSRGINKLVEEGKLQLMTDSRSFRMPSHVLYADDIMIFCRASKSSSENMLTLF